jgi:hypothetical protein
MHTCTNQNTYTHLKMDVQHQELSPSYCMKQIGQLLALVSHLASTALNAPSKTLTKHIYW